MKLQDIRRRFVRWLIMDDLCAVVEGRERVGATKEVNLSDVRRL